MLYYYPIGGKNPNSSEFIVPTVGRSATPYQGYLLDVQGSAAVPVEYLEFRGLTFSHCDWYISAGGNEGWAEFLEQCNAVRDTPNWWGLGPGVMLRGVRNCQFSGNTVTHTGGNGVTIYGDHVTLSNNTMNDIGATGVKQAAPASSGDTGANGVVTHHNTISNNTIHDIGVVFPFGMGILSMIASNNTISHNRVYNIPYMGIHCGRNDAYGGDKTNNVIAYNDVSHAGEFLGDSAAIYCTGNQPGTIVHHNKVHDCQNLYQKTPAYNRPDLGGIGLYLDDDSANITVRDNWVYRVSTGLLSHNTTGTGGLLVTNNVFAAINDYMYVHHTGGANSTRLTFQGNILYNTFPDLADNYRWKDNFAPGYADYNIIYNTVSAYQSTWEARWGTSQSVGLDLHSVMADPLFVDFATDDFNVQAGSPALNIGFQQIDMSGVGLQPVSYTIYASATTGGSVSPGGGTVVTEGGSQTFTIAPEAGHSVVGVEVDGVSVGAVPSYTFSNVSDDHWIKALFGKASGPPSDIELPGNTVLENQPIDTIVGMFTTTDPTPGDSHVYSLVTGTGSTDNASFTISGDRLLTAAVFNYETKASYSIRVRTTDPGGLWYERTFTITVTMLAPALTVTVAPPAVAEDGAANLVYTFMRSVAAGSPLMVNFSVGGTATYSTDYAVTGAASFTATSGTVIIPASQATAQVTVDPTADTTGEPDETVLLTVTAGTGYTVGTPAGATGTILNDEGSVNLALGQTAVASTTYSGLPAANVTDGNLLTRWSSLFSDPQWIHVDLGSVYTINRIVLRWEVAYGRSYQLQVSNDAATWSEMYSTTTGDGGVDDITLSAPAAGRYVRMLGTQRGTLYGYSLYEFQVYGGGGGGAPEVTVLGNGVSITDGDTTPTTAEGTDFGTVAQGAPRSVARTRCAMTVCRP